MSGAPSPSPVSGASSPASLVVNPPRRGQSYTPDPRSSSLAAAAPAAAPISPQTGDSADSGGSGGSGPAPSADSPPFPAATPTSPAASSGFAVAYNNTDSERGSPPASGAPASAASFQPSPYQNGSALVPKRSVTVRRVQLTDKGNLQIEVPVPTTILDHSILLKEGPEVTSTRYTACTAAADDFVLSGYTLRAPQLLGRQTELAVCMTMYNEDPYLFARSMHALVENMKTLLAKWGPDAWKRVVVVIVSDGRSKIHPGTLEALGVMGVYQDGVMKSEVGGREVASHIFEYTSQIDLAEAGEGKGIRAVESVPVQVVFCLKEQNAKKINSHRWFFNAFCPLLNPRICLLLDVGTRPSAAALYQMWDCFDKHPNVGGACGEIVADISPGWSGVLNPLVASQAFEYKISNQLDKPLESSFGYISVLPGAFSAYRYSALTNISPGVGPLAAYFHGESVHSGAASGGILESNMYLAEDRVLCFELVAKPGEAWVLRYIASAAAVTDVPETIPELVSQRRRWLNGSTFASIYAIANWSRIYKSDHSFGRKVVFTFQFLYHIASLIFSWFTLANFFLVAYFLLVANVPDPLRNYPLAFGQAGDVVAYVVIVVYAYLLVVQFLLSMGSKPASTITLYRIILMLWMGIMGIILYLIGFTAYNIITQAEKQIAAGGLWPVLVENSSFTALIAAMFACWGIWIVAGLLFLDPWHCIHSLMQFMLLSPFWNNVLQVYAMSNTHDVSWGTKGSTKAHSLGAANPIVAEEDKGPKTVELELPAEDRLDEANRAYQSQMQHLAQPDPAPSKTKGWFARPETTDQEESFRRYRVVLLVSWASSNLALVLVMTNPTVVNAMTAAAGGLINPYLQMLFWVSLGFSVVKFLGLLWYLLFQRLIDRRESIESEYVGNVLAKRPAFRSQNQLDSAPASTVRPTEQENGWQA